MDTITSDQHLRNLNHGLMMENRELHSQLKFERELINSISSELNDAEEENADLEEMVVNLYNQIDKLESTLNNKE